MYRSKEWEEKKGDGKKVKRVFIFGFYIESMDITKFYIWVFNFYIWNIQNLHLSYNCYSNSIFGFSNSTFWVFNFYIWDIQNLHLGYSKFTFRTDILLKEYIQI